jgi:hypothetical protein
MPKKNMQRTMVYLRPEQATALQQIFQEWGMRPAEAIRRAVDMFLAARKEMKDLPPDLAERLAAARKGKGGK